MKQLLIILLVSVGLSSIAQKGGNNRDREEQIQAQKVAFISSVLNLSPKEAEVFWPVYNEYDAKIEETRKAGRKLHKELRNMDEMSAEEAYSKTEELFAIDKKENAIRTEYLGKFAQVLDKKKAAKVFLAEERFKRELLKKIKKGNHQGAGHGGPPGGPNR